MGRAKRVFIPNQVFVGLPWRNVRPKYDKCIDELVKKYPVHFTIVGKNDAQEAADLFSIIKDRIASSSYAIFDVTGGNANVSLEFGYAEGIGVDKAIFASAHKAAGGRGGSASLISDLHGQRRVQYKTEKTLMAELEKLAKGHAYTVRFEKALTDIFKRRSGHAKRSGRALALRIVHALDGRSDVRRSDLIQTVQAQGGSGKDIEDMLRKLQQKGLIKSTQGRVSRTFIA